MKFTLWYIIGGFSSCMLRKMNEYRIFQRKFLLGTSTNPILYHYTLLKMFSVLEAILEGSFFIVNDTYVY